MTSAHTPAGLQLMTSEVALSSVGFDELADTRKALAITAPVTVNDTVVDPFWGTI
jgi:hypothetical protein